MGVAVGGTGVGVGGTGVAVGGTGVAVGGSRVAVGGTGVAVGGRGVSVGRTGVAVGSACAPPQPTNISTINMRPNVCCISLRVVISPCSFPLWVTMTDNDSRPMATAPWLLAMPGPPNPFHASGIGFSPPPFDIRTPMTQTTQDAPGTASAPAAPGGTRPMPSPPQTQAAESTPLANARMPSAATEKLYRCLPLWSGRRSVLSTTIIPENGLSVYQLSPELSIGIFLTAAELLGVFLTGKATN
jgi:hypothetical protein